MLDAAKNALKSSFKEIVQDKKKWLYGPASKVRFCTRLGWYHWAWVDHGYREGLIYSWGYVLSLYWPPWPQGFRTRRREKFTYRLVSLTLVNKVSFRFLPATVSFPTPVAAAFPRACPTNKCRNAPSSNRMVWSTENRSRSFDPSYVLRRFTFLAEENCNWSERGEIELVGVGRENCQIERWGLTGFEELLFLKNLQRFVTSGTLGILSAYFQLTETSFNPADHNM